MFIGVCFQFHEISIFWCGFTTRKLKLPFDILYSGNLSNHSIPLLNDSLEVVLRKFCRYGGLCVLWNTIRVLLVTAADAVSSCLSSGLSQFKGDEEGHSDYSCHTAHSSRVRSSVLINCEWGQTDTHYLSLGNALRRLQKGPPLHWCETSFLGPISAAVYTEKQIGVDFIQKLLGNFTKNWPVTHQIKCGIEVERLRFSCKTYFVALLFRKSLQCTKSVFATLYSLKILISKDIATTVHCLTGW